MLAFFLPLAAAQMLQTLRNPLLDAGISRGLDPAASLAAFGVIASLIQILGAAGTVIQGAYLVLVRGRESYRFMQRYAAIYIGFVSALALLVALPGVGEGFFMHAMGAPESLLPEIMAMMRVGLLIPIFNLIRLFFLAQLVHKRRTRVVWVAPAVGEVVMAVLALGMVPHVPLAAGVAGMIAWLAMSIVETLVLYVFVRRAERDDPYAPDPPGEAKLDLGYATSFALPLVITQFSLTVGHPLTQAGLLRLSDPETAVAGFRIAFSLAMIPMTALAVLRQVVLVMGRDVEDQARARNFSFGVGGVMFVVMALLAFTPVNVLLFETLIGAPAHIVPGAIRALQILSIFPLFMAVRQFYQSMTMNQRKTPLLLVSSSARLGVMAVLLFVIAPAAGWAGAWVGGAVRVASMGMEAVAATAIGWRYYGRPPAVRADKTGAATGPPSSTAPIGAKQPH